MTDKAFTNAQLDFVYNTGIYGFHNYLLGTIDDLGKRRNDFIETSSAHLRKVFSEDFINEALSMSYSDPNFTINLRTKIIEFIYQLHTNAYSENVSDLMEFDKFTEYFFDVFWQLLDDENYDYDGSEIDELNGY